MVKKYFIIILVLSYAIFSAQDETALLKQLQNAKHDTTRISIYIQLIEAISDDEVWPKYNNEMLALAKPLAKDPNKQINRKGKKGLADAYNNLGYLCHIKGEIPNALDYFGKSLIYQQELGDKAGEAEILGNMGVIYYNQKDVKKALDFYLRSLKLREEINDKEAIANSLSNIGNLCYDQKDIPKALYYTNRSMALQQEIGDMQGLSYSYNNLGGIYYLQGKLNKALEYYTKSLVLRKQIGDRLAIAASYNNISSTYLQIAGGKNKAFMNLARLYSDSSLTLAKHLGFPESIRNSERLLSKLDSAEGNFSGAFEHFKQYMIYKDSITNDENHKASMRSQIKYDFDKKEAILKEQRDKERAIANERHRVNKIRLWSVGIGLFLVLVFAVYIWRSLVQNRKANKIITAQKEIVEQKNHIIEEKQKEIIDSINYAKRIQYTLLAHDEFLQQNLNEFFVYFEPKDIVSGDFYWATKLQKFEQKNNELFFLAVCDSTGHGVPGAFMSLLNIGFLSEAINEKGLTEPHTIFNYVRKRLIANISKEGQKDGFDGILICIDKSNKRITYSAANNHPVLIHKNTLIELNTDRMPVGIGERTDSFNLFTIDCESGDILYLFTDGYADQFGGPKGKKYMYKRLNEALTQIHLLPMKEQLVNLRTNFHDWKGNLEQVDDVCIIGIRL